MQSDFSFVSLDGPWSTTSSAACSPRGTAKGAQHRRPPSARTPTSSPTLQPASTSSPLTACDLAIIAGGISNLPGSINATPPGLPLPPRHDRPQPLQPQVLAPAANQPPITAPGAMHVEFAPHDARRSHSHCHSPTYTSRASTCAPQSRQHERDGHHSSRPSSPTAASQQRPQSPQSPADTTQQGDGTTPLHTPRMDSGGGGLQGHAVLGPAGSGPAPQQRLTIPAYYGSSSLGPNGRSPDVVDHLLQQYHTSSTLALQMHLRTQKHIGQLQQYHMLRNRLQAAQAAMFSGVDASPAAQWCSPPGVQESPTNVSTDVQQAELSTARKGNGAPSVRRFHAPGIMQNGMYVASGDYNFAGSLPMRSNPSASLLFERYGTKDAEVPTLQRYYFRPERRAPKPQPAFPAAERRPTTARTLKNGIPVSRLHSEAATRRMAARAAKSQGGDSGDEGAGNAKAGGAHAKQLMMQPEEPGNGQQDALEGAMQDALSALATPYGEVVQDASKAVNSPRPDANASITSAALASLGAAGNLGSATAEPLLDDPFAALVKAHFEELAEQQTQRLQKRLNAGLPVLLQSMGVSAATLTTGR